jgi:hypothetical protein
MKYVSMKKLLLFCCITFLAGSLFSENPETTIKPACNHEPQPGISTPEQPMQVTLAFGEQLKMEAEFPDQVTWTISHEGSFVNQGRGGDFLNYVFAIPGEYSILINENHVHTTEDCGHHSLPSEIQVSVSNRKMIFDFEHATFSAPLNSLGISGLTLSVPVSVESYDGSSFLFEQSEIPSVGVGTNITAIPMERSKVLTPGNHILKYSFSGGVDKPTYVMFDFVDVNGITQPFSLTQQLY